MAKRIWTPEKIKEEASKYDSTSEFKRCNKSCYDAMVRLGLTLQITSKMNRKRARKLTEQNVLDKALEFKSKKEFRNHAESHYNAALKMGVIERACAHMAKPHRPAKTCASCGTQKNVMYAGPRCPKCYRKEVNPVSVERMRAYSKKNSATFTGRYSAAKAQAKERKIFFGLSKEQYIDLNSRPCFYCSGPLPLRGVGLDRLSNDKKIGYVVENVVPCCTVCNSIRGDKLSVSETMAAVAAVREQRYENVKTFHEQDFHPDLRRICVFGEINKEMALKVQIAFETIEAINKYAEITVMIMSPGGDWFEGLAIIDRIKASPCPVKTVGTGLVGSTATAIMQAGDIREITENCVFVLHDGTEGFEGEAKSFESWAEASKKSRQLLYEIYSEKSGRPTSFWQTLCLKDSILWSNEVLQLGLADRLSEAKNEQKV